MRIKKQDGIVKRILSEVNAFIASREQVQRADFGRE